MDIAECVEKYEGILSLVLIGLFLTFIDLYSSYLLHQRGYIEANPVMNYLSINHGVWVFIILNLIFSLLIISFLTWGSIKKLDGKWSYLPLIIYCVIRGIAAVNNTYLLM